LALFVHLATRSFHRLFLCLGDKKIGAVAKTLANRVKYLYLFCNHGPASASRGFAGVHPATADPRPHPVVLPGVHRRTMDPKRTQKVGPPEGL